MIDGEDVACELLHIGQPLDQAFDHIGKNGHEGGSKQGAKQRAHTADNDHRDVLDRQEQIKGFDRYKTTIVGEEAASSLEVDAGRDNEGEQPVANNADTERFSATVSRSILARARRVCIRLRNRSIQMRRLATAKPRRRNTRRGRR